MATKTRKNTKLQPESKSERTWCDGDCHAETEELARKLGHEYIVTHDDVFNYDSALALDLKTGLSWVLTRRHADDPTTLIQVFNEDLTIDRFVTCSTQYVESVLRAILEPSLGLANGKHDEYNLAERITQMRGY